MIAKAAAATVAAAFAFLVVAPRGYTSTAELYVEQAGPRVIIESQSNPDRSDNYLNTQTQIIASNPILDAAVSRPGMDQLHYFRGVDAPRITSANTWISKSARRSISLIFPSNSSPR